MELDEDRVRAMLRRSREQRSRAAARKFSEAREEQIEERRVDVQERHARSLRRDVRRALGAVVAALALALTGGIYVGESIDPGDYVRGGGGCVDPQADAQPEVPRDSDVGHDGPGDDGLVLIGPGGGG